MGGFEPAPDETRILQAVIAADMFFHLAIAAQQSVGQGILCCPLHGGCPGVSRPNGLHRGKNESRLHRRSACSLKSTKIIQDLIGKQRLLADGINDCGHATDESLPYFATPIGMRCPGDAIHDLVWRIGLFVGALSGSPPTRLHRQ
ncbi:hypothetical protein ACFO0A_13030 [Novosphingobium tardum]|uniref:Uncharacterized protein n=1 Tax=Novosphingobium tardum TaxID=1538021 RepID=A0ABV8RRE3_9SPHN